MPSNPFRRNALRAALAIHHHLHESHLCPRSIVLPASAWQQCTTLAQKLDTALRHDRPLAAERLHRRLQTDLARLRSRLPGEAPERRPRVASAVDIFRDLEALRSEFPDVVIHRRSRKLLVTTPAITIQHIHLGPFQMELDWTELPDPECYRVTALEPNPAGCEPGIHHPHVQDDRLCEGEARPMIAKALAQGRLLDFFLIIAQTLQTYNSGSAYAQLSEWEGSPCIDCGARVGEEAEISCADCGGIVCSECSIACRSCDCLYCSSCSEQIDSCTDCRRETCPDCACRCTSCQRQVCPKCLENQLCEECKREAQTPEETITTDRDKAGTTDAA